MKRALVIRHVPFEGLAGLAAPIAAAGYAVDRLNVGDPGFDAADLMVPDLLVLMGGPMGVYERDLYPWIEGELARLSERLRAGRPTLGICLGAQMIAAALGAEVAPGPVREVGFAPIEIMEHGLDSPLAPLAGVPVLHWHGDGFALPEGATLLARTAAFAQAFSLGPAILALQCHPEMGLENDGMAVWLERANGYPEGAGTNADTLRAEHARYGAAAVAAGQTAFAAWLAALPDGA